MVGAGIDRERSGALPLEWRLQAVVVVCNILPVLLIVAVLLSGFFYLGIVIGPVAWYVGGVLVLFVLSYAGLCLMIASALWRRSGRARFAAISVFLLYLLVHAWAGTGKPLATRMPRNLKAEPGSPLPTVVVAVWRLLPLMDFLAIGHLGLRWRQFSRSAKPNSGKVNPG